MWDVPLEIDVKGAQWNKYYKDSVDHVFWVAFYNICYAILSLNFFDKFCDILYRLKYL